MKLTFDRYDLEARVAPGLLVVLPGLQTVYALLPGTRDGLGFTVGGLMALVALLFVGRYARDHGKRAEKALIDAWGCWPTTQFLRHRDERFAAERKARWHAALGTIVGAPMPTADEEARDPHGADRRYATAVGVLIEARRGPEWGLLHGENRAYGFARNLYGMRRVAGGGAAASILAVLLVGAIAPERVGDHAYLAVVLATAVLIALATFMTPDAVRRSADAYAVALLRTLDAPPRAKGERAPARADDGTATS